MHFSIVIPLYNESDSVVPLFASIDRAVAGLGLDYEIVLVDDGSADDTFERAAALVREHPEVRVVRFRRNYGQTSAMAAGIEHARGRVLITMDGDLQNDPADIPHFLRKIDEGYDLVVGWRHERKDKLVTRKIPSRIANWLIGKVTGVPIRDNGCSLKAFRASVIKRIPLYSEMHRFIPAMASMAAPRIAEIKVNHHARRFGKSKYGLARVYKVLLDLLSIKTIIGFSYRPLLWFTLMAAPVFVISLAGLTMAFYEVVALGRPFSAPIAGIGLLFGALALFLVMTGMFAELVFKTRDNQVERLSLLTAESLPDRRAGPAETDDDGEGES